MDIATCVNELDASTIQDVKKIQNTIYPGTYNKCIFIIQKMEKESLNTYSGIWKLF